MKSVDNGATLSFAYIALGQRVKKSIGKRGEPLGAQVAEQAPVQGRDGGVVAGADPSGLRFVTALAPSARRAVLCASQRFR